MCGKAPQAAPEGKALARCSRCKSIAYCNKACQSQHWPQHKANCGPPREAVESIRAAIQAAADGPKRVLLISIEDMSWLGDMYSSFIAQLNSKSDLVEVNQVADAVQKINNGPQAVLLFEPSLMNKKQRGKHQTLNDALVSYVRAGGTVVFGCQCSSHVRPPDLEWYFSTIWNLPWTAGNYARYDFQMDPGMEQIKRKNLPTAYNVKALQLKDVEPGDVVYHEHGEAHGLLTGMYRAGMIDFNPHGPNPGANGGPVIWKKYEDGYVGWTGDVNNEGGTQEITLRMCGL
jgi:hypothetical protein